MRLICLISVLCFTFIASTADAGSKQYTAAENRTASKHYAPSKQYAASKKWTSSRKWTSSTKWTTSRRNECVIGAKRGKRRSVPCITRKSLEKQIIKLNKSRKRRWQRERYKRANQGCTNCGTPSPNPETAIPDNYDIRNNFRSAPGVLER